LAKEPLIFFEYDAFDWSRIHTIFEASQLEPRIEFHVDNLEVAKSLILNGNGIGFLPRLSIKKELEEARLHEVDVSHIIKVKQSIYLTQSSSEIDQQFIRDDILLSIEKFESNIPTGNISANG
jgi:DNA-binding transcriptional LysR family regulator